MDYETVNIYRSSILPEAYANSCIIKSRDNNNKCVLCAGMTNLDLNYTCRSISHTDEQYIDDSGKVQSCSNHPDFSNCVKCLVYPFSCTECASGYVLNSLTGKCNLAPVGVTPSYRDLEILTKIYNDYSQKITITFEDQLQIKDLKNDVNLAFSLLNSKGQSITNFQVMDLKI